LDGARDISAVFYVKIQIGGKFLVEQWSINEYLFVFNCCLFCFLSVTKWIIKQLLNSACAGCQNYLDIGQCYLPQPSASADNIDLGLNNSGYPAQPHSIIVNNFP
jgi:hypothetical protein